MKTEVEYRNLIERAKIRLLQLEIETEVLSTSVEFLRAKKEELLDEKLNAESKRDDLIKDVQAQDEILAKRL